MRLALFKMITTTGVVSKENNRWYGE